MLRVSNGSSPAIANCFVIDAGVIISGAGALGACLEIFDQTRQTRMINLNHARPAFAG
jgi:hypothetical protein